MYVSFHRSYCSIKLPLLSNTTASPMQMHPLEMRGSLRAGTAAIPATGRPGERHLARLEPREQVGLGEPAGLHPVGPAGEAAEHGVNGVRLEAVTIKPVGEAIDVIGSGTRAQP